jgi:hypothetical protein
MPPPRERIPLEDGVRLDLSWLARRPGKHANLAVVGSLRLSAHLWERRPNRGLVDDDDGPATGFFALVLDEDEGRGSLSLGLEALQQTIALIACKRGFGGRRWFFLCPMTGAQGGVARRVKNAANGWATPLRGSRLETVMANSPHH